MAMVPSNRPRKLILVNGETISLRELALSKTKRVDTKERSRKESSMVKGNNSSKMGINILGVILMEGQRGTASTSGGKMVPYLKESSKMA
jgi:hypothetical protein